ncbi:MAG: primosomal protein N' [Coriobacteriales bacterium]|jgi:primosomal protein N' (replication factor Y)|nr:primosomal protein N' [Coriobacteriales bacterium]
MQLSNNNLIESAMQCGVIPYNRGMSENPQTEQASQPRAYAQVVLDIATRALDSAFDYAVPPELGASVQVGCCVLVDFGSRPALGYVVGLSSLPEADVAVDKIKPLRDVLSTPWFDEVAAQLAFWIAREYLAPLSETIRLFTPPGAPPKLKRDAQGNWQLAQAAVGAVDDRWVQLTETGRDYRPPGNAAKQRAILDALRVGEMRVAELALEISSPAASLKALEKRGVVRIESRRRIRGQRTPLPPSRDITMLTPGQRQALEAIVAAIVEIAEPISAGGFSQQTERAAPTFLLDGVTGSGKTEVYLQVIRKVLEQGRGAIVLVPEISLTPQTVARFRSRFGEQVAVLHSRLTAGERYDQWDLVRSGAAQVVVGARSALFAPLPNLGLVVIDEEHEASYKQGSSPRYHARTVASKLVQLRGASLVLGSATPAIETLYDPGVTRLLLPERATGQPLPPIQVVDLRAEFQAGNRSMYSRPLQAALQEVVERREKAVVLLNRRGFASFLLCRDCGFVPMCDDCATSLTYHEHPPRLICHHCAGEHLVPGKCPECGSPYLRQLGKGTQFACDELVSLLPEGTPVVRMDADSTRGKDGHEQRLEEFIAASHGVLLGTQMIAKGLDFPEVTLVGVLIADTALKFPDFRAAERTFQLLEQVAGRAGRQELDGRVIVQTYWPEHVAIRAAAAHDRELLLADERQTRQELGYPPFSRLANILIWGADLKAVSAEALKLADALIALESSPAALQVLGPSPCVLSKRQGSYRWHILLKAPPDSDLPALIAPVLQKRKPCPEVSVAVDIDPSDMM